MLKCATSEACLIDYRHIGEYSPLKKSTETSTAHQMHSRAMTHVQVLVWDLRDYNGGSWLTAEEGHTSTGNAKLDAKLRLKVTHQLTFL